MKLVALRALLDGTSMISLPEASVIADSLSWRNVVF